MGLSRLAGIFAPGKRALPFSGSFTVTGAPAAVTVCEKSPARSMAAGTVLRPDKGVVLSECSIETRKKVRTGTVGRHARSAHRRRAGGDAGRQQSKVVEAAAEQRHLGDLAVVDDGAADAAFGVDQGRGGLDFDHLGDRTYLEGELQPS